MCIRDSLKGTSRALQFEMITPPTRWGTGEEGRLVSELRLLAQSQDARTILTEAAIQFKNDPEFANACADLAVSGRSSYEAFAHTPSSEEMLVADVKARIADTYGGQVTLPDEEIANDVKNVLDRAYKVAFALRGPYPASAAVRQLSLIHI